MNKLELKQAVILAGGRGERLRPTTDNIPKPMAPINGTPFLDYLINSIIQAGIKRILLLLGYKGEIIKKRYDNLLNDEIEIKYSIGKVEDQTGRRILNAYELLDDWFLLLYGDNYWPVEIDKMLNLYNRKNVKVTTTVFSNKNGTGEYGKENNVVVDPDNMVRLYDKQRKSTKTNGVDIGYFVVDKKAISPNIRENISFEEDILPKLISKRQLAAYITDTQYYYITNINNIKHFESIVVKNNFRPLPRETFHREDFR